MQLDNLLDGLEFTAEGVIEITRMDILDQVAGGAAKQTTQQDTKPGGGQCGAACGHYCCGTSGGG